MQLWFTEPHTHTDTVRFTIRVDQQIYSGKSRYQRIDVFESPEFGRILTLDGFLMVTEKDEFIYHDMMVHVPMAVHPDIRKVLVIGAGDGGTIRELCRYDTMEAVDMAEIDEQVVTVCKEHFPQTACRLDDPRVSIHFQDGLRFVRSKEKEYDLILVDSTDPFGPGEGLFTKEFYGNCYKALKDDGILVNQLESVYYNEYAESMKRAYRRIHETFPIARVYQAHIPTYPSGHWLFGFASKRYDPLLDLDADTWNRRGLQTKYYNTDLHKGAFAIPNYVKEKLQFED